MNCFIIIILEQGTFNEVKRWEHYLDGGVKIMQVAAVTLVWLYRQFRISIPVWVQYQDLDLRFSLKVTQSI